MIPTAAQIIEARENHRRPGRTLGARVRDALMHVKQSAKEDAAQRGGAEIALSHAEVTHE